MRAIDIIKKVGKRLALTSTLALNSINNNYYGGY